MPTGNYGKYKKRRLNAKEIILWLLISELPRITPKKICPSLWIRTEYMRNYGNSRHTLYRKALRYWKSAAKSFTDGNIERAEYDAERMILRACQKGKPTYRDGTVIVEGKYYKPL